MGATRSKEFRNKLAIVSGAFGIVASIMFYPNIFNSLFAAGSLQPFEYPSLRYFSIVLAIVSAVVLVIRKRIHPNLSMFLFTMFVLLFVELFFRAYINSFHSHRESQHEIMSNRTYLQFTAYKGHPFTLFTGRPSIEFDGNESLGKLSAFNNYGFVGPDFNHDKSAGVTRIAALGGSTTISGYPQELQYILNDRSNKKFEVMNFGMTYWTSANTLSNFLLNVIDFNPDIVIFHHGWNDAKVRGFPDDVFRNDYSHALSYFREPEIPDLWALRCCGIYREIKRQLGIKGEWEALQNSTIYDRPKDSFEGFDDLSELYPFKRNLETLIAICQTRRIKLILMTQPHSTDPNIAFSYSAPAIDQTNEIVRFVHKKHPKTDLIDLDKEMTGKYDKYFKDLGHFNEEGIRIKAQFVSEHILRSKIELQNDSTSSSLPEI